MTYGYVDISYLSDIASAIREKNGLTRTYKPSEMAAAIRALSIEGPTSYYSIYDTSTTAVGVSAYKNDSYLTAATFTKANIVMPDAFFYCSNLSLVSLPACTSIGNSAFSNCYVLASASLPVCENVGNSAFSNCYTLASVNLPACTSVGNSAFNGCTVLSVASLPVCTSIGSYAFYGCYNLVSLYLTSVSTVPALGSDALGYTPIGGYLKSAGVYGSVYVPASLYGSFVIAENWSLVSSRIVAIGGQSSSSQSTTHSEPYVIYDTVAMSVPTRAYCEDSYLTAATFTQASVVNFDAFRMCANLSVIGLPVCTEINTQAFMRTGLTSVDLPMCTTLGTSAFAYCTSLSKVSLPACKNVGVAAFEYCTSLTTVSLPECSVISAHAFAWCKSLASLYLTYSYVATFGEDMFVSTPMLDSSYIGRYGSIYVLSALYSQYVVADGWSSLSNRIVAIDEQTSSTTPAGAYSIYDTTTSYVSANAYLNDTNLTQATFTAASWVGQSAFAGCTALSKVVLPACSEQIQNYAFEGCTSLMMLDLHGFNATPALGISAFFNTPMGTSSYTGSYGTINVCGGPRYNTYVTAYGWSQYSSRLTALPTDYVIPTVTEHTNSYSINDSIATYIPSGMYSKDSLLTAVTFTKVESVGMNAFYSCENISYISLPKCEFIGSVRHNQGEWSPFYFIRGLKSLYLPKCSYVDGFDSCYSLASISLPNAVHVGGFDYCIISRLSLPKAEFVYGFDGIQELTTLSLPVARYVQGFYGCNGLTTVSLPSAYSLAYTFSNCTNLTTIRLSEATELGTDLDGCYALRDIYMNHANAYDFSVVNTRTRGGYSFLTIHVPSDMVSELNRRYSDCSSYARFVAI